LKIALDYREHLKGAWRIVVESISTIEKRGNQKDIDFGLVDALIESTKEFDKESLIDFVISH
jgi:hypothetical protein